MHQVVAQALALADREFAELEPPSRARPAGSLNAA
jgi:hypothetical protein